MNARSFRSSAQFLLLVLTGMAVFSGNPTRSNAGQEHVIIVTIDGARYSETFGDSLHRWIPHLWKDLRPAGTLFTQFYNNGKTSTNPGHASILTGAWQWIANNGSEHPHAPTVFEYYRMEFGSQAVPTFLISGKSKLQALTYSDVFGYGVPYDAVFRTTATYASDLETWEIARNILQAEHPQLAMIHFAATDIAAHSGNWNRYVGSLRQADSLIYELWKWITSDSVYAGKTTLFLTNDHGRHLDGLSTGFRDHGDTCEGCRHIMLMAIGPQFVPGAEDTVAREQIDLAPTTGAILGFSTPYATGKSLLSPLEVRLVRFSGTFENGQIVLAWETDAEEDGLGFAVERKGRREWQAVGFVRSSGRESHRRFYRFTEPVASDAAPGNILWYRLKWVGRDGSVSYSPEISVKVETLGLRMRLAVFPNPSRKGVVISGRLTDAAEDARIEIYDLLGRLVWSHAAAGVKGGNFRFRWPGTDFRGHPVPGGIYFVKLTGRGNAISSRKILILH